MVEEQNQSQRIPGQQTDGTLSVHTIHRAVITLYLGKDVGLRARVRDVSRRVELLGRAEHVPRRHPQLAGPQLLELLNFKFVKCGKIWEFSSFRLN